jgi:hypothetical protein
MLRVVAHKQELMREGKNAGTAAADAAKEFAGQLGLPAARICRLLEHPGEWR